MAKTRIGFRGFKTDNPEKIFQTGFTLAHASDGIVYGGGIDAQTGICVSWRLSAACLFPINNTKGNDETWIYIVNIPLPETNEDKIFLSAVDSTKFAVNENKQSFVNTHSRQVLDILKKGETPKKDSNYEMLFAEEIAVTNIAPQNVIGYVKCTRTWKTEGDWVNGGTYELHGPVFYQEKSKLDSSIPPMLKSIDNFLVGEIKLCEAAPQSLPVPESGYFLNGVKTQTKQTEVIISDKEYNELLKKLMDKKLKSNLTKADFSAIPNSLHTKLLSDIDKATQAFEQSITPVKKSTPQDKFFNAIKKRKMDTIKKLAKKFMDAKNNQGYTGLHLAIGNNDPEMMKLFINAKANINLCDAKNNTPLHLAVKKNNLEAIYLLFEAKEQKINIDAQDIDGFTPLHLAGIMKHINTIKLLIEKHANIDAKDHKGYTALHHATVSGHMDTVLTLLNAKANINAKNIENYTPLHLAARNNNIEILQLLIQRGADIHAENSFQQTPFDCAIQNHQLSAIKFLMSHTVNLERSINNLKDPEIHAYIMLQLIQIYIQKNSLTDSIPQAQLEYIKKIETEEKPNWSKAYKDIIDMAKPKTTLKSLFSQELNISTQKYLKYFSSEQMLKDELIKSYNRDQINNLGSRPT